MSLTVNADGTHEQRLFVGPSEFPHWSPDGGAVSIFCCDNGMAAHVVDPDNGSFRELAPPDPTLEIYCGIWSSNATRFACESFGVTDASRNGIHSIRASDGGGLQWITSNPGGDGFPGDHSPDGERLVFVRAHPTGQVGLFVTGLNGDGLRRISPAGMIVDQGFVGSWSPTGNQILFPARTTPGHHRAIWVVNADGSALRPLAVTPSCGGPSSEPTSIDCFDPGWSPDGTMVVFTRKTAQETQGNIYTVHADGSGLFQVTYTGRNSQPDWGPD